MKIDKDYQRLSINTGITFYENETSFEVYRSCCDEKHN